MSKVICIGDLHGDYQVFLKVLKMCKLINDAGNWIGGTTTLIQMGDTLDGKRPDVTLSPEFIKIPGELQIFEKIIKLKAQATKHGGNVISLLGNHELYPYYIGNNEEFLKNYVKKVDIKHFYKYYKKNRVELLKPTGLLAKSVLSKKHIIYQIGKILFVHGSITDSLIKYGLSNGKVDIVKINKAVANWMITGKNLPAFLKHMDSTNPVFSRLYSNPKKVSIETVKKINEHLSKFSGAEYVVIGHTPFKKINMDGKVIRTDVALSRAFGGTLLSKSKDLQALQIINPEGSSGDPEFSVITEEGIIPLQS